MTNRNRVWILLSAATLLPAFAGCQMLHELQPHRLKRMNHGVDGMPATDYARFDTASMTTTRYFASISDPFQDAPVPRKRANCPSDGDDSQAPPCDRRTSAGVPEMAVGGLESARPMIYQ